ncbi:MAG: glycosyltransferase [Bacteroidota bacterium]|nr:glycosyltransferase [Bacteroidota bacterium]
MDVLVKIIFGVQVLFIIYFCVSAVYYLLFAIAGLYNKLYEPAAQRKKKSFCILIPGYKEDIVIVSVAKDALKQAYPAGKYDVYVIADSFKAETIKELNEIPVNVIEVSFAVSTKAKAINKALEIIDKPYDAVVILDADNLMDPNFLKKMNNGLQTGAMAIQAHRMAKNLDTSFSVLDAISEEVNNHIFRRGHRALGLSSALIGSGMVFKFDLYKRLMSQIDSHAEDKELEIRLFTEGYKIEFYDKTFVLDEKVSKSDVFLKQRSRWIANQLYYARHYFFTALRELFRGNIDFFDKIFQYMLPPGSFCWEVFTSSF